MKNKYLTLQERWALDIEAAKAGGTVISSTPQCKICKNWIDGNALQCKKYDTRKPKDTLRCKKECPEFNHKSILEIKPASKKMDQLMGGIFGFAVADALGVPLEFSSREDRKKDPVQEMRAYGTYHQYFGTWSDDSSLTFCLMESLKNGYDLCNISKQFCKFYYESYWTPFQKVFDIGNTTVQAIEKMKMGVTPIECGGKNNEDNGNGSLMRILPLAFYLFHEETDQKIKVIEEVSSLTHAHNCSKLGCIIYVEFAINLIKGNSKLISYKNIKGFVDENLQTEYINEISIYANILTGDISTLSQDEIQSTGYIVHTLEAALWSFLTSDSYRNTILKAINLGGDTDTIAAIAGGLAGIYYGLPAIPGNWLQCLARKEEIYELILSFGQSFAD
jgi:ADP-ribosylglycohydrolase